MIWFAQMTSDLKSVNTFFPARVQEIFYTPILAIYSIESLIDSSKVLSYLF